MAHNMVRMPICVCVFLILQRVETGYCSTIKLSVALSSLISFFCPVLN